MTDYDPKVIQEYSARLIKQSRSVAPMYFFLGLVSGLIIFAGITAYYGIGYDFIIISIGVMAGAFCGYGAGQSRASELRLQAHLALCQLKIEEHLRRK